MRRWETLRNRSHRTETKEANCPRTPTVPSAPPISSPHSILGGFVEKRQSELGACPARPLSQQSPVGRRPGSRSQRVCVHCQQEIHLLVASCFILHSTPSHTPASITSRKLLNYWPAASTRPQICKSYWRCRKRMPLPPTSSSSAPAGKLRWNTQH